MYNPHAMPEGLMKDADRNYMPVLAQQQKEALLALHVISWSAERRQALLDQELKK